MLKHVSKPLSNIYGSSFYVVIKVLMIINICCKERKKENILYTVSKPDNFLFDYKTIYLSATMSNQRLDALIYHTLIDGSLRH